MVRWVQALSKTRRKVTGRLASFLKQDKPADAVTIEELEDALIGADISARLAAEWLDELDQAYGGLRVDKRGMLKELLLKRLGNSHSFDWSGLSEKPYTILVVGVNGSGKTTTCAKLAYNAKRAGLKPLLGASDTFRAAGADQLKLWADKLGCESVIGAQGADAAAVAYDALDAAIARQCDVLIIDTAGRMHTKRPLMDELQKVERALKKRLEHTPDEVWVVLDAALGQNAIEQAKIFHKTIPLTGAVVAKLDGSSKAGFIFSIKQDLEVPVRMVGLGETEDSLVPFEPAEFVDALLAEGDIG